MRRYRGHFGSFLLSLLTHLAALIAVLVLGFLAAYIFCLLYTSDAADE